MHRSNQLCSCCTAVHLQTRLCPRHVGSCPSSSTPARSAHPAPRHQGGWIRGSPSPSIATTPAALHNRDVTLSIPHALLSTPGEARSHVLNGVYHAPVVSSPAPCASPGSYPHPPASTTLQTLMIPHMSLSVGTQRPPMGWTKTSALGWGTDSYVPGVIQSWAAFLAHHLTKAAPAPPGTCAAASAQRGLHSLV